LLDSKRTDLLCFSVDHLHTFDFDNFVAVFAREVIPTQFAFTLESRFDENTTASSLILDPVALAYFSLSAYQFEYPFSLETDIDRLLVLFARMNEEDIIEEIALAGIAVTSTGLPFSLRLHGFNRDSRPLWEIPEAAEMIRIFVENGGMSVLEVTTTMGQDDGRALGPRPLGALEVWTIFRGFVRRAKDEGRSYVERSLTDFLTDLSESNVRLDQITKSHAARSKKARQH
jgi:hypothetical protein